MDYKIYIPKSVYLDKEITHQELITYCALYMFGKQSHDEYELVTIDNLLWRIYGDYEVGRKIKQSVADAVEGLIVKKKISCEQPSKGIYILKSNQFVVTSQFVQISYGAMKQIMKSNYKNKNQLFRYYCVLMGSRSGVSSHMKVGYFANALDISDQTVVSYNKLLEDMHIIYVMRNSNLKSESDGGIYRDNNVYCAYEDRLELFSAKSMGQKIAQIKCGKKYSSIVMQQVDDYIVAHNEREMLRKKENPQYVMSLLTKLD